MSQPRQQPDHSGLARALGTALWVSLIAVLALEVIDAWRRAVPFPVWVLWLLPLLVFVPGLLRSRLRTVAWLSFVSLLYFVLSVLRVFAEPSSVRALLELAAVIGLFISCMFYLRVRGRELREHREALEKESGASAGAAPEATTRRES
jgi:uncharacterized membrane protein